MGTPSALPGGRHMPLMIGSMPLRSGSNLGAPLCIVDNVALCMHVELLDNMLDSILLYAIQKIACVCLTLPPSGVDALPGRDRSDTTCTMRLPNITASHCFSTDSCPHHLC